MTVDDLSQFDGSKGDVQSDAMEIVAIKRAGQEFYIGEPHVKQHRISSMQNGMPERPVFIPPPDVVARCLARRSDITYTEFNGAASTP